VYKLHCFEADNCTHIQLTPCAIHLSRLQFMLCCYCDDVCINI